MQKYQTQLKRLISRCKTGRFKYRSWCCKVVLDDLVVTWLHLLVSSMLVMLLDTLIHVEIMLLALLPKLLTAGVLY